MIKLIFLVMLFLLNSSFLYILIILVVSLLLLSLMFKHDLEVFHLNLVFK